MVGIFLPLHSLILILCISLVTFYRKLYVKLTYFIRKPILYLVFYIISEETQLFLKLRILYTLCIWSATPWVKEHSKKPSPSSLIFFHLSNLPFAFFLRQLKSQWLLQTCTSVREGRGSIVHSWGEQSSKMKQKSQYWQLKHGVRKMHCPKYEICLLNKFKIHLWKISNIL